MDEFYRFIKSKKVYEIEYLPFGEVVQKRIILPLLLKEFNHRWNLIAFDKSINQIQHFPLERIGKVALSTENLKNTASFDGESYFKDVIGITINDVDVEVIVFKITKKRAFYVNTKKIHYSQEKIREDETSMTFCIAVKPNNEMWAKFMELSENIEIIEPIKIKNEFRERIKKIYDRINVTS